MDIPWIRIFLEDIGLLISLIVALWNFTNKKLWVKLLVIIVSIGAYDSYRFSELSKVDKINKDNNYYVDLLTETSEKCPKCFNDSVSIYSNRRKKRQKISTLPEKQNTIEKISADSSGVSGPK